MSVPSILRSTLRFSGLLLTVLIAMTYWQCRQDSVIPLDHRGNEKFFDRTMAPFYHGVASGDPLLDRVIIWTRVTPDIHGPMPVHWEFSTDPDFQDVIQAGEVKTDSTVDYTVKIDVSGLEHNTSYYYRFLANDRYSPVGRTRTAPGSDHSVRLAIISCNNYEAGYYNVLRNISEREDLTAVVHLGDYIYELASGLYGDSSLKDRKHLPPGELITLSDYRTRYSQYKLDPDLQAAHQMHPFIAIWDDHEIANNAYSTGGQNHQPDEGNYEDRRNAASKAYFEWLPLRDATDRQLYRSFYLSGQAQLIMLDERLAGRTEQVDSRNDPRWASGDNHMLGKVQFQWLLDQLAQSQATWKIIGNQVIFSELNREPLYGSNAYNMDAWDGYPEERRQLLEFLTHGKIGNVLIVSGDTHASWALDVPDPGTPGSILAVELATPSITSANTDEQMPVDSVRLIEQELMDPELNPHLKYVNLRDHGYLELTLDSSSANAVWHYTTSVSQREAGMFSSANWQVFINVPGLKKMGQ